MLKRAILLTLLLILSISATFEQGLAADHDDDSYAAAKWPFPWWWRPPWRRPPQDPNVTKCLAAFRAAAICLRPPIGEECCSALETVKTNCADNRYGRLDPSLVDPVLKEYLPTPALTPPKALAPNPSKAPTPATKPMLPHRSKCHI
ncbi:kinase family protein [Corchorus olitorius]|uniref:Kinase family protein n=1 Tax=Corchorus olitorius TaxID=93759 RepID=A0A1R3JWR0_9ROSI|nr:kinase family protein [Corchorus olitorius]